MQWEQEAPDQLDDEEHQDVDPKVEEQSDPTTLTDIMREMMLMMRIQCQQHTFIGGRDLLTEFERHTPPPFAGTTDPTVARYQISKLERTFQAMHSSDEEKVKLASYMLRDSAAQWFENELRVKREDAFKTCKEFEEAFYYTKYFPLSRQAQMERQFLSLKQGSISIEEYKAEFDRLSPFASFLCQMERVGRVILQKA